jgi:hypothetical protein
MSGTGGRQTKDMRLSNRSPVAAPASTLPEEKRRPYWPYGSPACYCLGASAGGVAGAGVVAAGGVVAGGVAGVAAVLCGAGAGAFTTVSSGDFRTR